MRIGTKLIAAALVSSATLVTAMPAQAQYYGQQASRDRYDDRYDRRDDDRYDRRDGDRRYEDRGRTQAIRGQIEQLERRIRQSDWRDHISEREANNLRQAVSYLRQNYNQYARNGLDQREARLLQDRIQHIRERLQYERNDGDRRRR